MRKWFIVALPLFLWAQFNLRAQDQVGCTQLLVDAREAYDAGMVELVPELLLSCLESGLSGEPKQEAYKLVITSYLFDYLPEEADLLMQSFLAENPHYQTRPGDAAEFVLLLEAHQKQAAEKAAALAAEAERERLLAKQEEAAREEAEKNQNRNNRQSKPAASRTRVRTEAPRLGLLLGASASSGLILEPFSLGNPMNDGGAYKLAPGLQLGVKADFPLSPALELGLSLLFNRVNLNYSAEPFTNTSYAYHECQNRLQLPVSLAVYLNPMGRTRAYFRFGFATDFMLSASAYGTRTQTGASDVELDKASISESRAKLNLSGLGGFGLNIPMKEGFFFVEASYTYGLLRVNDPDMRYANQDILWLLYHVDSDYKLGQVNLQFGMTWNLK